MNSQKQLDFLIQYLVDERDEIIDIPNNQTEKRNLFRALMNIRPPKNISNQFLEVQDKFLTDEMLNKNLTSPGDIEDVRGKLMLWQGDIVTLKVDAIVNAANSKLLGCFIPLHNCIDNVIHSAAGVQLRQECDRIMRNQGEDEKVGRAKITDAYNLPSKYVIHTVGPAIPRGLKPSQSDCEALKSCYNSCLQMASEHNLESMAFCCISTGVFNFPKQMAAEIAVKTVKKYLDSNKTSLQHVIFNVFDDESYAIYKKLIF